MRGFGVGVTAKINTSMEVVQHTYPTTSFATYPPCACPNRDTVLYSNCFRDYDTDGLRPEIMQKRVTGVMTPAVGLRFLFF